MPTPRRPHPPLIQGGMGVAVSGWRLARAVAGGGQLGVVSGTALDAVLARRLQLGDPGGHMRRGGPALPLPGGAPGGGRGVFLWGGDAPGQGKGGGPPPHVPAGIPELEPAREHGIERGPGHHPELPTP
ncbi:hypothetical protein ADK54_20100, partial [Streptomyces sp. WM6378]